MNAKKILELADVIERQPTVSSRFAGKGFRMADHRHSCGTPSCIMGWASWMFGGDAVDVVDDDAALRNIFSVDMQIDLTYPVYDYATISANPGEPGHITASHAAAVLRHLAETGEVDWTVTEYTEAVEELTREASEIEVGVGVA